jgi:hypothetical protein
MELSYLIKNFPLFRKLFTKKRVIGRLKCKMNHFIQRKLGLAVVERLYSAFWFIFFQFLGTKYKYILLQEKNKNMPFVIFIYNNQNFIFIFVSIQNFIECKYNALSAHRQHWQGILFWSKTRSRMLPGSIDLLFHQVV